MVDIRKRIPDRRCVRRRGQNMFELARRKDFPLLPRRKLLVNEVCGPTRGGWVSKELFSSCACHRVLGLWRGLERKSVKHRVAVLPGDSSSSVWRWRKWRVFSTILIVTLRAWIFAWSNAVWTSTRIWSYFPSSRSIRCTSSVIDGVVPAARGGGAEVVGLSDSSRSPVRAMGSRFWSPKWNGEPVGLSFGSGLLLPLLLDILGYARDLGPISRHAENIAPISDTFCNGSAGEVLTLKENSKVFRTGWGSWLWENPKVFFSKMRI